MSTRTSTGPVRTALAFALITAVTLTLTARAGDGERSEGGRDVRKDPAEVGVTASGIERSEISPPEIPAPPK
ncbi:hypothetical protein [Streptomyces sp. NPDC058664]|uniref:hypothetical protein n=1 Tax=unclassified Streptomyces TaxID=2593676 RepID=UPI0036477AC9